MLLDWWLKQMKISKRTVSLGEVSTRDGVVLEFLSSELMVLLPAVNHSSIVSLIPFILISDLAFSSNFPFTPDASPIYCYCHNLNVP